MSKELFSKKDTALAAFQGLISGAQPILQAANVPIACSVLASVSQIIKLAGTIKTNKEACESMADRCVNLLLVIKDFTEGVDTSTANERFWNSADELQKKLQLVEDTMENLSKQSRSRRLLHSSDITTKVQQCNADLDRAMELFNFKIVIGQDKKLDNADQKLDKIIEQTSRDITVGNKSSDGYVLDREPPARPDVFHGRELYVKETVDGIISGRLIRVPILGPGGIGKTSLASAIIDNEDIHTKFDEHRYFIRCGALSSAQELVNAMRQIIIGPNYLKDNPKNPLGLLLQFLENVPKVLIVLDNLETVWHVDNQQDIKKVLTSFFKLKTLVLIITMRGSLPPEGFAWSDNKSTRVLPTLGLEDAKQTFRALCTHIEDSEEFDKDLSHLMMQLDCVPLAVCIVAHIACLVTPKEISSKISQYLETYRDDPDNSIKASVSLSLNSFVIKRNPVCLEVLKIIAYLPGGVTLDSTEKMMQLSESTSSAQLIAALMAAGLVHKEGRSVLQYYYSICEDGEGTHDSLETHTRLTAEKANCIKILTDASKAEYEQDEDYESLLTAIINFSWYLYYTIPSLELLRTAEIKFKAFGNTRSKAEYKEIWGLVAILKCNWHEAREMFLDAREQFNSIGDRVGAAGCLWGLGDIARMESKHDEAKVILLDVIEHLSCIGDREGVAHCLSSLGDIARMESKYDEARVLLMDAREHLSSIGDRRGAAGCLWSLGELARLECKYDEARETLLNARQQYSAIGDGLGVAECLEVLGLTAMDCHNYEDAKQMFLDAITMFEQLGVTVEVVERCQGKLNTLSHLMGQTSTLAFKH